MIYPFDLSMWAIYYYLFIYFLVRVFEAHSKEVQENKCPAFWWVSNENLPLHSLLTSLSSTIGRFLATFCQCLPIGSPIMLESSEFSPHLNINSLSHYCWAMKLYRVRETQATKRIKKVCVSVETGSEGEMCKIARLLQISLWFFISGQVEWADEHPTQTNLL